MYIYSTAEVCVSTICDGNSGVAKSVQKFTWPPRKKSMNVSLHDVRNTMAESKRSMDGNHESDAASQRIVVDAGRRVSVVSLYLNPV